MRYLTILLIAVAGFIFNSCEFLFSCIEGDGEFTTEDRAVITFSGVRSAGDFDVEIVKNPETYVKVEADENLQQYINIYVQNGNLIIETDQNRCLQSQNRILVTVYCPYLETVALSGSGDIQMSEFTADYFNAELSGSGDIDISLLSVAKSLEVNLTGSGDINIDGKADDAKFYLTGSGDIRGEMMRVNSNNVVLSGSGDVHTYVYNAIKMVLSGSGNIYYFGNPSDVQQRITGSGDIIKK